MPEERYLKEIASELKLIRKELQRMNNPPEPVKDSAVINSLVLVEGIVDGRNR